MIDFRPRNFLCPRIGEEVLLVVMHTGVHDAEILYGCSHRDVCNACRACVIAPATLWDCPYNEVLAEQRHS